MSVTASTTLSGRPPENTALRPPDPAIVRIPCSGVRPQFSWRGEAGLYVPASVSIRTSVFSPRTSSPQFRQFTSSSVLEGHAAYARRQRCLRTHVRTIFRPTDDSQHDLAGNRAPTVERHHQQRRNGPPALRGKPSGALPFAAAQDTTFMGVQLPKMVLWPSVTCPRLAAALCPPKGTLIRRVIASWTWPDLRAS